jgi:hypothetical protein
MTADEADKPCTSRNMVESGGLAADGSVVETIA